MITKTRLTFTIDKKLAKESKRVCNELLIKRSTFLNTILQALVDSETKPMRQVYGEVYGPLFDEMKATKEKREKLKKKSHHKKKA